MAVKRPPGPAGNFLLGSLRDFSEDQPDYLLNLAQTYGGIVYLRLAHFHVYLLSDSDAIREVLISQRDKFEKSPFDRKILGKFLGNGLITNEGASHQRQRRLAQPAFHSQRIRNYAEVMVDYTEHMLATWQDGQERDMAEEMTLLTMLIVSKTLFDADAVTETENTAVSVGNAIHILQEASNRDYRRGFLLPDWLPTPTNRSRNQAVKEYNATVEQIIAERRATAVNGQIADTGDLLSMLMLSEDEAGSRMNDRQLRDEVATLFAAGHETTSNALSWTWYLLSQNPAAEARLHAELDAVLGERTPTLADLATLPYTLQIIKESMRLYPPAWILNGRMAITDTEIGGYTIPKGSTIFVSPYVNQRLPQYFDQPGQFIPERWTKAFEKDLPKFAYMPFGGGPRICIGNAFAQMEAHLILATIARQYRLSLLPDTAVQLNPQITLSPLNGLPMRIEKRAPIALRDQANEKSRQTAVIS